MQEFGPFRLHRSLGATPLGASFLAETPWEATPFCVVEIHSVPLEARDVGPKHPNIVDRLAMGSIGGRSYLAKELVLGKNVARILPRIRALRRPTPPSIAVRLWADLLTALAWLHERRPHGAVSPENVIVAYAGVAKLELVEGAGGSIEAD